MNEQGDIRETDIPELHLNNILYEMIETLPAVYMRVQKNIEPETRIYHKLQSDYYAALLLVDGYIPLGDKYDRLPENKHEAVKQIKEFLKEIKKHELYSVGVKPTKYMKNKNTKT